MKPIAVVLAAAIVAGLSVSAAAQDLQRGLRNYQEIVSGRKKLNELPPQERNEVISVVRLIQARQVRDGRSPECRDALADAESKASDLADSTRRLRSCAESQDYSDDCSSEFSRVRSAHSDYESAVSDVGSACN